MTGNQQVFHKAMNSGHSAAWDQHWDQAAKFYRQALEEFPEHPGALTSLGLALFEMGDMAGALQPYQRAAALSADDPAPQEKLAAIYEKQGQSAKAVQAAMLAAELHLKARDVDKSLQSWNNVVRLDPENRAAHTRLAMIYEKLGRKNEAVTEYIATASLLQRGGDPEKARQAVQYCLQLVPNHQEAQAALGMLKTGQLLPKPTRPRGAEAPRPSAARQLEAAALPGDDPIAEALKAALVELADLLFAQTEDIAPDLDASARKGLSALARGAGGSSGESAERTRIQLHLGQAIDSQTRKENLQAAAELERALEIGLNSPALTYDLGYLLADHDSGKALRYLNRSVKHPDYALASYLMMATIRYHDHRYAEAASDYLNALRLADIATVDPAFQEEMRQLYEPIMDAQTRESDPDAFKKLCETIAEQLLRPGWQEYLALARTQLPKQPAGSPPLPLAEMLLESGSSQVIESQSTIRDLTARGQLRGAMEEAFYALKFSPTYLPLHVQIGELLLKEGHNQAAVDKFLLVARLYGLRGDASQAIQVLKRAAEMSPMEAAIRDRLIELLVDNGRIDEAVEQHMLAADIRYRMAELDTARHDYMKALKLAQQSRNNRRWAAEILTKVADIDLQKLDFRQALRILEQLRTIQPEDAGTRARIIDLNFRLEQPEAAFAELEGYLSLLNTARQQDQALSFLTDLVNEQPGRASLHMRLAEFLAQMGDKETAVKHYDQAADLLLEASDKPGARRAVQAIIALNPANVDQYRVVLESLK